ncbi:MAG: EamA family transporter [Chloroflexi bacterium]|nr:EamA family transporter [Chloroflexota bacterium]
MKTKDWLAFVFLGLLWGSSFLWIKIAVREIGPLLLVSLRLLFGILALLLAAFFVRPAWPRDMRTWALLAVIGLINTTVPYVLISWGEQYIDSSVASVLNATTPLFTMLLAHFTLQDDRISRERLGALGLGFVGVLALVSRDLQAGLHSSLLGQAAVLLASVSYSVSNVFLRMTTQNIAPMPRALIPLLGADLILWGIAPVVEAPLTLPRLPLTWIALLWLGVLCVAVAYGLYFHLLHSIGPTRTTLVTYVFPLVGLLLGVTFLGERLDWRLAAGAGLIVSSILIANRKKRTFE